MNAFKKLIALLLAMMIALMASTAPCFADELNANGQLNIDSITVGTTTYTNVLINLGTGWSVVSVGGSCTSPQVLTNGMCVTPTTLPAGYVSQGGLIWMPVSSTWYTYAQATALCAGTINGQSGWRMPTQPELSAFYTAYPNYSSVLTGQGWTLNITWSSTPNGTGSHRYVSLLNGGVDWSDDTDSYYVTCVR